MKQKIIKIITIIINFIMSIALFTNFFNATIHTDGMGINFICSLPALPISIALIIYAIMSIINVFQNKVKITIVDKIIIGIFIFLFINALIITIMLKVSN